MVRRKRWVGGSQQGVVLRLLLLTMALTTSARSAPPVPPISRIEQARQEVLTALSVGNPGHAEEILDRAFRIDPDPAFLYQLGLVAQAQGRSVAALDLYRRYQELVGTAIKPETAAAIEQFAAGLVAQVTVLNVTARPGLLLCVDDKVVGMLPLPTPLLLESGTHRFRLEGRGERYESGALAIPEGREADLRLTPGANGKAVALLSISPIALLLIEPQSRPEALTSAVYKALLGAARKNHRAPLPQERLDVLLRKRPAACLQQADCQLAVAEEAEARSILRVQIQARGPGDAAQGSAASPSSGACSVRIEYLDVNAGQVTGSGDAQSRECSGPLLMEALSAVLQQLQANSDKRSRAMVSVTSTPEGAQVRVDGLLRGQTPYLKASFSGLHEIVVEKPDFHPFSVKVQVVQGEVATVQAPLRLRPAEGKTQKTPSVTPSQSTELERRPPRPRWRLITGGVALGVGLIVTGFGLSALSQDGACADAVPVPTYMNCLRLLDTTGIGTGLLAGGLAVALSGTLLLAIPEKKIRVRSSQ